MKIFFWFYRRFIGTIFFLWLFLQLAKEFGFAFALDLSLFFKLLLILLLVLVVWEIRIRWLAISQLIKNSFYKTENEFIIMTRTIQKEIAAFSPEILAGRIGRIFALVLAVVVTFFCFFWGFLKVLIALIFQPLNVMLFMILGIFAYIFIFDFTSGLIILILIGSLIYVVRKFRFNGKFSLACSLIFLTMCPFLLILKKEQIAEKTAIWTYVFLVVGVVQTAWESRRRNTGH